MKNTTSDTRKKTARAGKFTKLVSDLYEDTLISDVTLCSGNIKAPAHRFILHSIPFFKAMLNSNMKESNTGIINLTKTIPPEELKNFVKYLYHGTLDVTADNALALLNISQQLMLEDMADTVCEYLGQNISSNNCLVVLEAMHPFLALTNRKTYHETYKSFAKYFAINLEETMKSNEFSNLPWNQIAVLLSLDEHLSEQVVFEAAMLWMEQNQKQVETNLRECLSDVVRLPQLSYKYLANIVMTHPILLQGKGTNQYQDLICDAFVYQVSDTKPTGKIRYKKRTGYVKEAYKITGIAYNCPALTAGYYIIEKNPNGSYLLYAKNSNGYILQDSGSSYNEFQIGKSGYQRIRSKGSAESILPSSGGWRLHSGHNTTLYIKKVDLDFNGKEVPIKSQ